MFHMKQSNQGVIEMSDLYEREVEAINAYNAAYKEAMIAGKDEHTCSLAGTLAYNKIKREQESQNAMAQRT